MLHIGYNQIASLSWLLWITLAVRVELGGMVGMVEAVIEIKTKMIELLKESRVVAEKEVTGDVLEVI